MRKTVEVKPYGQRLSFSDWVLAGGDSPRPNNTLDATQMAHYCRWLTEAINDPATSTTRINWELVK